MIRDHHPRHRNVTSSRGYGQAIQFHHYHIFCTMLHHTTIFIPLPLTSNINDIIVYKKTGTLDTSNRDTLIPGIYAIHCYPIYPYIYNSSLTLKNTYDALDQGQAYACYGFYFVALGCCFGITALGCSDLDVAEVIIYLKWGSSI